MSEHIFRSTGFYEGVHPADTQQHAGQVCTPPYTRVLHKSRTRQNVASGRLFAALA